jgi:hypothetical protein
MKNPFINRHLVQDFLLRADDRTHLGSLYFLPKENKFLYLQCQVDVTIKNLYSGSSDYKNGT